MKALTVKDWEDLPRPLNCFTVRSVTLRNLDTGGIIRYYSANTKIVVVQKCVRPEGTYYRTAAAAERGRNYAFPASAFGLQDEVAPLEHIANNSQSKPEQKGTHTNSGKKHTVAKKPHAPKNGEERGAKGFLRRIFRIKKA